MVFINLWIGTSRFLTDSGGFQVFSLVRSSKDKRRGRTFPVHILMDIKFSWDRRKVCRFSRISRSTIAMAFDECPSQSGYDMNLYAEFG
ncbi:MAG: hypothetical protein ACLRYY_06395 [Anaerobutyricum soehngenii]